MNIEKGLIIKTRKLSAREVKKKLRDFIDEISEDCGPEVEQMAEELKAHGDEFIDSLSGEGNYRGYGSYRGNDGGMNGGGYRGNGGYRGDTGYYRNGGRAWHRNEGTWEEREEQRKRNEQKLQELDRQMKELRQQMSDY